MAYNCTSSISTWPVAADDSMLVNDDDKINPPDIDGGSPKRSIWASTRQENRVILINFFPQPIAVSEAVLCVAIFYRAKVKSGEILKFSSSWREMKLMEHTEERKESKHVRAIFIANNYHRK